MIYGRILWNKVGATLFGMNRAWNVTKVIAVSCMCFALVIGCGEGDMDDSEFDLEDLPNVDDPIVRAQILLQALDEDNLQTRQAPSGEKLHYTPNQQVPYTGWVRDDRVLYQIEGGKRHGLYVEWYSNQQNEQKGFYSNGSKTGVWTYWYEDGQKEAEGTFKDGSKNGLWIYWYRNGQKEKEGTYKDDSENGLWAYWNEDGQKEKEGTFTAGSDDVLWTYWDEDGQKHSGLFHESVSSVSFSPDGRTLASGNRDGAPSICGMWLQVRQIRTLEGHTAGCL